jgi:hypothetical protein
LELTSPARGILNEFERIRAGANFSPRQPATTYGASSMRRHRSSAVDHMADAHWRDPDCAGKIGLRHMRLLAR